MNKSQRIPFDRSSLDDKHIKLKLEQDVDFFEFMSMKISTKEFYENFNANYGVLVGRVIANEGIGVPNAKISIFIPLQEEDENNNDIINFYPYKTPRDKNSEGKRYNLLPRVSSINPINNSINPKQPFGSFPIKPEIVTNPKFMKIYEKYYKYSTVTNDFGDYMIFGVPTGVQTVHMSVDITDIGKYSMTPPAMVTNLGYSPNLFTDNNTRIKPSTDLDDLVNIETQEISVDVIPFWGDVDNFDIGITRQDFRIRAQLINTITIFGTTFTDGEEINWGGSDRSDQINTRTRLYEMKNPIPENLSINRKRISRVNEKIYYYPANISDSEIDSNDFEPIEKALVLNPSEYSSFKRDGDFVFILNANRNKIITDDLGNDIPVSNDSVEGIFTEFRGFITFEYDEEELPISDTWKANNRTYHQIRYKFKIPQYSNQIGKTNYSQDGAKEWRKQDFTFKGGRIYSVSRFISTNEANPDDPTPSYNNSTGLLNGEILNDGRYYWGGFGSVPNSRNGNNNVGLLVNMIVDDLGDGNIEFTEDIDSFKFPTNSFVQYNGNISRKINSFGGNWMNFAIYFPQVARNQTLDNENYSNLNSTTNFHIKTPAIYFYYKDNSQNIAAGITNTKWYARNDLNWLDFIEVDIRDLNEFKEKSANDSEPLDKGFKYSINDLIGDYRNGTNSPSWGGNPCPQGGGRINGDPNDENEDPNVYFYRGWGSADCIQFLQELNII